MTPRATRPIDAATAAGHLVVHLAAAREAGDRTAIPRAFRDVGIDSVRLWPAWVVRAAVLKSRTAWWLWCEPRKGARGGGQFVMDVPNGRYLVDVMDTRTHAWFSRESAAGGPLVAGLPATGRPVIARIRRVAEAGTGAGLP
jgi:hypothetical protein